MISTSLQLDGEKEFKRELGEVNSNLRTLKSNMQLTTEEFKGQANSVEALEAKARILNDQYQQQEEKVRALERAMEEVGKVYADQPRKVDEYQQSLNRAKADLIKMSRELQDNERYLREAQNSADQTAKSIDEFGREMKDAGKETSSLSDALDDFKGLVAGGAVVAGLTAMVGKIEQLVDETEEYRKIMGTLEVSSQKAGYTAEETAAAYNRLYGVLGDTQSAATTVANLQAIGLSQQTLMALIDATTGAWTTYGDSIPIDGLAESINETIKAGQVTGVFADVLNWAGTSEDAFNESLATTTTETERAAKVLVEMADQGLVKAGQAWRDNNAAIIETNEAQAEYEEAQARLAEKLIPFKTQLLELKTQGWDVLTESIQTAIDLYNQAMSLFAKESELRKDGLIVSHEDRMAAYGYEAYYNEEGLLRYREKSTTADLASANVSEAALTEAALLNAAESAAMAANKYSGGGSTGDINIVIHEEVGGAEVARKQYSYNQAEAQRRGTSLVNK